jgi:hypothetical protein
MDEKEGPQEPTPLVAEVARQQLEVRVKEWIDGGYEQTSYKYRMLNRIPPGKTGLEALKEISPAAYERILAQANHWAAEEYKRLDDRDRLELTREEFKEHRRQTNRGFHEP